MNGGIPQVGDDGSNGAPIAAQPPAQAQAQTPLQGLSPEKLEEIRQAQATLQAAQGQVGAQPPQPEIITVSREDMLEAENLHLRLLVCAYKVKDAQQQAQKYSDEQSTLQSKIIASQGELQKKYNIDLQTHEIDGQSGIVIPRGSKGVGFGQLMQHLAQQQQQPPQA